MLLVGLVLYRSVKHSWRDRHAIGQLADACGSSVDLSISTETGSYFRLIDSCITQLKAQGPSGTCNESKEEEEASSSSRCPTARCDSSSHKACLKSFFRSQLPHKSVNLSFTTTNMKNKLMGFCGNRLLQNVYKERTVPGPPWCPRPTPSRQDATLSHSKHF